MKFLVIKNKTYYVITKNFFENNQRLIKGLIKDANKGAWGWDVFPQLIFLLLDFVTNIKVI